MLIYNHLWNVKGIPRFQNGTKKGASYLEVGLKPKKQDDLYLPKIVATGWTKSVSIGDSVENNRMFLSRLTT